MNKYIRDKGQKKKIGRVLRTRPNNSKNEYSNIHLIIKNKINKNGKIKRIFFRKYRNNR